MKILVIDDEVLITMALKRALEKRGHSVDVANAGLPGVEAWRRIKPDVVVLDFMMPDMNADQILNEIGDRGGSKVVLMSAYLGDKAGEKSPPLQIEIFIKKPFENIFDICDLIEKAAG